MATQSAASVGALDQQNSRGGDAEDAPTTPQHPADGAAGAGPDDDECDFNVLVAGLPRDVDEVVLRSMFEQFGTVKRAIVMYKANTAQSRGFGFVLYGNADDGNRAITSMDGTMCGGNALSVRRSKHDGRVEESELLFVRNIPKDVPIESVLRTFEVAIASPVRITKLSPGSTAAVVTVTLQVDSIETARRAIDQLHLKPFTSFYQALEDAPPLPPMPEGRLGIPDMLVKFAESELSRTVRHNKSRSERPANPNQHAPPHPQPGMPGNTMRRADQQRFAARSKDGRTPNYQEGQYGHGNAFVAQSIVSPFGYGGSAFIPGHQHHHLNHQHHNHSHHHQHQHQHQHHQQQQQQQYQQYQQYQQQQQQHQHQQLHQPQQAVFGAAPPPYLTMPPGHTQHASAMGGVPIVGQPPYHAPPGVFMVPYGAQPPPQPHHPQHHHPHTGMVVVPGHGSPAPFAPLGSVAMVPPPPQPAGQMHHHHHAPGGSADMMFVPHHA